MPTRNHRTEYGRVSHWLRPALLVAVAAGAFLLAWGLRSPLVFFGIAVAACVLDRVVFADALGRLWRGFLAARALARLAPGRTPASPVATRAERTTSSGHAYDLYPPSGGFRRTLVAVHGISVNGARDERLVRFAEVFSAAGFRVAVPDLRGLRAFREDPGDVEALRELFAELSRPGEPPVAVAGFSFGGGLALRAACDLGGDTPLGPLLLVGAFHDIHGLMGDDVFDGSETPAEVETVGRCEREPPEDDERAWDDFLYFRFLQAHRRGEELGLGDEERAALRDRLAGYCADPDLPAKRRFYREVVQPREAALAASRIDPYDREALAALSPAGRLGALPSTVLLLHDPDDRVIPPAHSRRLYEELRARRPRRGQRLLVSRLLAHVAPRDLWRLHDLVRLLGMFGALFSTKV